MHHMLGTKESICTRIGCSLLSLLSQFNSSLKCSWQPDKLQVTKQMHVGMEPSQTNQTRWEWHYNTFPPSLHLVPFCQLCIPQNSLHALNLFTPTKWTLYSALLTPQPQTTFNGWQARCTFSYWLPGGCLCGDSWTIQSTSSVQLPTLSLWCLSCECPWALARDNTVSLVHSPSLSVCLSICRLDWRYLTKNSFHPWCQT